LRSCRDWLWGARVLAGEVETLHPMGGDFFAMILDLGAMQAHADPSD
jgi:hypothetical protein